MKSTVNLRYIQELLGHDSSMTTEPYTDVSKKSIARISTPLEYFSEPNILIHIRWCALHSTLHKKD